MAMRIMLRTWLRVSECLSLCPANHQPEAGGDGEQGETGPRGPHPRRLGGVPGGSGVVSRAKDGDRPLIDQAVAGNSPVYGPGWEFPLVVAQGVAGKPGLFLPGRTVYFWPFQPGVQWMTLFPHPGLPAPLRKPAGPRPSLAGLPAGAGRSAAGAGSRRSGAAIAFVMEKCGVNLILPSSFCPTPTPPYRCLPRRRRSCRRE